jgi:hypothetical protein
VISSCKQIVNLCNRAYPIRTLVTKVQGTSLKGEEFMLIGALIMGLLGGIFGLLIGLFGYTIGGIAGAGGLQILSMAVPMASIIGGGMAKAKPLIAGGLMLLSAIGMFFIFGFNFFTAIPLILSAVGGVLALVAAKEVKPVATT